MQIQQKDMEKAREYAMIAKQAMALEELRNALEVTRASLNILLKREQDAKDAEEAADKEPEKET